MKPNIGVILVCRYNSRRLPGKILKKINGKTILEIIYQRILHANKDLNICVATSTEATDDPIERKCIDLGISFFRGSLNNPSKRFKDAMNSLNLDYGIRINGDNIFVDYDALGEIINLLETNKYEFISNVPGRTFPIGMSIEAINRTFYNEQYKYFSNDSYHKEHIMSWFYEINIESRKFLKNSKNPESKGLSLAIDTKKDFTYAEKIISISKSKSILIDHRQIIESIKSIEKYNTKGK